MSKTPADLHFGICTICEEPKPVAACCDNHQIPVCQQCFVVLPGGECGVYAKIALNQPPAITFVNQPPAPIAPEPLVPVEPTTPVTPTLPPEDLPPAIDPNEDTKWWSQHEGDIELPNWEVVAVKIADIPDMYQEEDGEPIRAGYLKLTLGRQVHCPGTTAHAMSEHEIAALPPQIRAMMESIGPHEPHTESIVNSVDMIVPMGMVDGLIEGMLAVKHGDGVEQAERWMDEQLQQLVQPGEFVAELMEPPTVESGIDLSDPLLDPVEPDQPTENSDSIAHILNDLSGAPDYAVIVNTWPWPDGGWMAGCVLIDADYAEEQGMYTQFPLLYPMSKLAANVRELTTWSVFDGFKYGVNVQGVTPFMAVHGLWRKMKGEAV